VCVCVCVQCDRALRFRDLVTRITRRCMWQLHPQICFPLKQRIS
jgi:hypothetical protein